MSKKPYDPWWCWLQQRKRDKRSSNDQSAENDIDDRLQVGFDTLNEDDIVEEHPDGGLLTWEKHDEG